MADQAGDPRNSQSGDSPAFATAALGRKLPSRPIPQALQRSSSHGLHHLQLGHSQIFTSPFSKTVRPLMRVNAECDTDPSVNCCG